MVLYDVKYLKGYIKDAELRREPFHKSIQLLYLPAVIIFAACVDLMYKDAKLVIAYFKDK